MWALAQHGLPRPRLAQCHRTQRGWSQVCLPSVLRPGTLPVTPSRPAARRWTRCSGLGWIQRRPGLCPGEGVLRGGTDRCQNTSVPLAKLPEAKITIHSHCTSTQPRWCGAGSELAKEALSPPRPPEPVPGLHSRVLGISFASGPRELIGFSGCTCSRCPASQRVLERSDKDRPGEVGDEQLAGLLCPLPHHGPLET